MVAIRTKRLILREFKSDDWRSVYEFNSDPEVVRYLNWGPHDGEQTRAFVRDATAHQKEKPRRKYTLAVTLKIDSKLIGGCNLKLSEQNDREGKISYCLNRHYWDGGYGTETAYALLKFGFEKLGLRRIYTECDRENDRSLRILKKIGMQQESHIPYDIYVKGKPRKYFVYEILEDRWRQMKPEA